MTKNGIMALMWKTKMRKEEVEAEEEPDKSDGKKKGNN